MRKMILSAAAALVLAGCTKEAPAPSKGGDAENFAEMTIPASFEWKTTTTVACDFTAAHPSRVFVASARGAEPFASFLVGGDAEPVQLDLPAATKQLFVSYETDEGVSVPEAVSVSNNAPVTYSMGAKAKDYTGLEDGDKNTTIGDVIHMPSEGWGTLLFEDLWPSYGDYDFNDYVVSYKVQLYMNNKNMVREMVIGVVVRAVGGSMPYDLCLRMNGVQGKEIDQIELLEKSNTENPALTVLNTKQEHNDPAILRFENIRQNPNRQPGAAYINTEEGYEMPERELVGASFHVAFKNSIPIADVAFDEFDFFISRLRESDNRHIEVHMGGYAPTEAARSDYEALKRESSRIDKAKGFYYSNDGLVWALNVPAEIAHPYEKVDILKAYPELEKWAQSGGTQAKDWYKHGVEKYLVPKVR